MQEPQKAWHLFGYRLGGTENHITCEVCKYATNTPGVSLFSNMRAPFAEQQRSLDTNLNIFSKELFLPFIDPETIVTIVAVLEIQIRV